jgi:hypothetical protein
VRFYCDLAALALIIKEICVALQFACDVGTPCALSLGEVSIICEAIVLACDLALSYSRYVAVAAVDQIALGLTPTVPLTWQLPPSRHLAACSPALHLILHLQAPLAFRIATATYSIGLVLGPFVVAYTVFNFQPRHDPKYDMLVHISLTAWVIYHMYESNRFCRARLPFLAAKTLIVQHSM